MHAMNNSQPHQKDKSRQLQRKLYLAAKGSRMRRFHALFDRIARLDILWRAWHEVKQNRGSCGIDGQTIEEIASQGVEEFLLKVQLDLKQGWYRPTPARRVYIPKPDGSKRPLGIPTVRDRVVQQACRIIIEPIFEADFNNASFGFRPKRSAKEAVEGVRTTLVNHWCVVDADIQGFFEHLNHELLMRFVEQRISDRRVLKLLRQWLKAGVLEEGRFTHTEEGTPQGGVISPLLANIYLDRFDRVWTKRFSHLGKLTRYADDFVVICLHKYEAQTALEAIQRILAKLHLKVHPQKTRLVDMGKEGFDFLGFHIRKVRSVRTRKLLPFKWPSPKAMKAIREKIKECTQRRWTRVSLSQTVKTLNPIIRGWRNYFCSGRTKKLQTLDVYVGYRLRKLFKAKHGSRAEEVLRRFTSWKEGCGIEKFHLPNRYGYPSMKL